MKKSLLLAAIAAMVAGPVTQDVKAAQGDANFVEVTSNISGNVRWTRDNVYILTRMIFVTDGATLTIEPGTIVRGVQKASAGSDLGDEPGTFVVSRGGKVIANGTADDPIIFTSIDDYNVPGGIETVPLSYTNSQSNVKNVSNPLSPIAKYAPDSIIQNNGFSFAELWGGFVMLGRAHVAQGATGTVDAGDGTGNNMPGAFADDATTTNNASFVGADVIEGIDPTFVPNTAGPSSDKLGVYGGVNDSDSSGVLRFVSIRYAGNVIGSSNELNSLTCGGVGDATVLEHIECTFNTDDGYEWFGGKVNSRFLFSLYNRDDAFDADEGFRTTSQFWTAMQGGDTLIRSNYTGLGNNTPTGHNLNSSASNSYNRLMEIDGAEPNQSGNLPATQMSVYNFTFLGGGDIGSSSEYGFRFRHSSIGNMYNGVVENLVGSTTTLSSVTTSAPFTCNVANLHVNNCVLPTVGSGSNQVTSISGGVAETSSQVVSKLPYNRNTGTGGNTGYDPRLAVSAGARTDDGTLPPSGMAQVRYAGSVRDNTHLQGWSQLNALGVLPGTHPARIVGLSMGLSGNFPTVSFAVPSGYPTDAKFVVERSTDGRVWVPVEVVVDNVGGDGDAGAGSITVTDTVALGSTAVKYRAYGL